MHTIILSPDRLAAANGVYETLRKFAPKTRADLRNYLKVYLGIDIGDRQICPEHNTPMDYLWHCYSSDFNGSSNGDCIVWAGCGGGKTFLAAVATLLDCIFKPNCKVRILAGSRQQAQRMYDYLLSFLHNGFEHFSLNCRQKQMRLFNNSDVEVLTQSAASIRGSHIQKLRCDEVELFNRQILETAKFATKSTASIAGAMESLSTMHQPFGLCTSLSAKRHPAARRYSNGASGKLSNGVSRNEAAQDAY